MKRTFAFIGVPSSAGAHWPGQEKAPTYLRNLGLLKQIESSGYEVLDFSDLPLVRFNPDKRNRQQQNIEMVVEVALQVAEKVELALQQNAIPLVIGGDCTIGLGVLAGFLRCNENIGLLYFDGHVDLNTPVTSPSGILDSMGMAHIIAVPGSDDKLSRIGLRFPLMPEDKIVLFGYNPLEMNDCEKETLAHREIRKYLITDINNQARIAATDAVQYLESRVNRFVVHFDVDVIDFTDLPIADVPQFSEGLKFKEVLECLAVFTASPKFGGLTITEFNPNHTDEEGSDAKTFVNGFVQAIA